MWGMCRVMWYMTGVMMLEGLIIAMVFASRDDVISLYTLSLIAGGATGVWFAQNFKDDGSLRRERI